MTIAVGYLSEKRTLADKLIVFAACFALGLDTLFMLSEEVGFYKSFPHLLYLNQPFEIFFGPLIYYRFRIMIEGKMKFNLLTLFLSLPGVLAVIYFIPFYFQSGSAKLASVGFHNLPDGLQRNIYLFIMYSALPWIIFCIILIIIHRRNMLSKKGRAMIFQKKFFLSYNSLWILIALIIYFANIGRHGFMLKGILLLLNSLLIFFYYFEKKHLDFFLKMRIDSSEMRYKKSMVKGIDTKAVVERIKELMSLENIYLDENLSLRSLSSILGITPHQLSEILNTELNTNFKSLVNGYRVAAVKKLLLENNEHLSIIQAAYRCGFNTKNNFNIVFHKSEGMSPSKFLEKNSPSL